MDFPQAQKENLTVRQCQEHNHLITVFPVLGEAYRLKKLIDDFLTMDNVNNAAAFLFFWWDLAQDSKMHPFIKFANTLKAHWSGISTIFKQVSQMVF